MKLIPLDERGVYSVGRDGGDMGTVILYDNPFHRKNAHVKLNLTRWEEDCAPPLFVALREEAGRPLQAMTDSGDARRVNFLAAGGFRRVRRCWEVNATAAEYLGPESREEPVWLTAKDEGYDLCCRRIYDHYRTTHEKVSPLTAAEAVFCAALPETAACGFSGGELSALAFVEENEIAYVWGRSEEEFVPFAAALTGALLRGYGSLSFECDDCDAPAMWLKKLFRTRESEDSFDTYVYGRDGTAG